MIRLLLLLLAASLAASPAAGQQSQPPPPKPLFASGEPLRITIRGPILDIARNRSEGRLPGTLTVAGTNSAIPVTLSARGLTRRQGDICQFPPLWVRFPTPPAATVFAGQKSLKLVTHCRASESFQQHVLLEYAAYTMFNALTPASFRVRLATIDYVDDSGRPVTSRTGFFIEDLGDVARRNGMQEAKLPSRISATALEPDAAALNALYQHMLANHDWSMRAGPPGDECCHNFKLIAPARGVAAGVVPVPYDFDYSGFVNAPYATPPDILKLANVRQRLYRGYCGFNNQLLSAAVRFQAARPAMLAALAATPGLSAKSIRSATAYLDGFYADIASPDVIRAKLVKTCI